MGLPLRFEPGACRVVKLGAATLAVAIAAFGAGAASAQDLSHRFVNPSFGGNPFYSDHLLAIANVHRPDEPEEPAEDPPTEEELLAAQLRSQFLAQLSSEIRTRIFAAQPGDSGSFDLGTQRISFVRRGDQIEITFLDTTTGEESRIVIPASASPFGAVQTRSASVEQALGSGGQLVANAGALGAAGQLTAPNVARVVPRPAEQDAESRLLGSRPLGF